MTMELVSPRSDCNNEMDTENNKSEMKYITSGRRKKFGRRAINFVLDHGGSENDEKKQKQKNCLTAARFELAPSKRVRPKRTALDHSATPSREGFD
jgi:hypothetical protein